MTGRVRQNKPKGEPVPAGNDVVVKRVEKSPDFEVSVLWNRKRPRSGNLKKLIDILRRNSTSLGQSMIPGAHAVRAGPATDSVLE